MRPKKKRHKTTPHAISFFDRILLFVDVVFLSFPFLLVLLYFYFSSLFLVDKCENISINFVFFIFILDFLFQHKNQFSPVGALHTVSLFLSLSRNPSSFPFSLFVHCSYGFQNGRGKLPLCPFSFSFFFFYFSFLFT